MQPVNQTKSHWCELICLSNYSFLIVNSFDNEAHSKCMLIITLVLCDWLYWHLQWQLTERVWGNIKMRVFSHSHRLGFHHCFPKFSFCQLGFLMWTIYSPCRPFLKSCFWCGNAPKWSLVLTYWKKGEDNWKRKTGSAARPSRGRKQEEKQEEKRERKIKETRQDRRKEKREKEREERTKEAERQSDREG